MAAKATSAAARTFGQYALYGEIAAGGMATIHFGRLIHPDGTAQIVAIKRLHPQFAKDAEFRTMFLDEARVAVHVTHPNVVPTLDVVGMENELFLVMEYVAGESLSRLIRVAKEKRQLIPPAIVVSILANALRGLHAAHIACDAAGKPLHIVHRDISPQNVLVGIDGVARVLDFGVAKAVGRHQQTREGQLKGKIAYMSPEQLNGQVSPRTDVYAAGVTLWEALTGKRLFNADNEAAILGKILSGKVEPPSRTISTNDPALSAMMHRLDAIVLKALERDEHRRFESALAMAEALEDLTPRATPAEIGKFVQKTAHDALRRRTKILAAIESNAPYVASRSSRPPDDPNDFLARTPSGSRPTASGTPPAIEPQRFGYGPRPRSDSTRVGILVVAAALAVGALFAAVGALVIRSPKSNAAPPVIQPATTAAPALGPQTNAADAGPR